MIETLLPIQERLQLILRVEGGIVSVYDATGIPLPYEFPVNLREESKTSAADLLPHIRKILKLL